MIEGMAALLANLGRVTSEITLAEERGLAEGAEEIRGAWIDNITSEGLVLTGTYRDSIIANVGPSEATVGTEVPYAPILEFGDSRQAAHPVAERAFDEHHEKVTQAIGRHIGEAIR